MIIINSTKLMNSSTVQRIDIVIRVVKYINVLYNTGLL